LEENVAGGFGEGEGVDVLAVDFVVGVVGFFGGVVIGADVVVGEGGAGCCFLTAVVGVLEVFRVGAASAWTGTVADFRVFIVGADFAVGSFFLEAGFNVRRVDCGEGNIQLRICIQRNLDRKDDNVFSLHPFENQQVGMDT
jgi:hypothetical protein